jgi:hypothetical protein
MANPRGDAVRRGSNTSPFSRAGNKALAVYPRFAISEERDGSRAVLACGAASNEMVVDALTQTLIAVVGAYQHLRIMCTPAVSIEDCCMR